MTLEEALLFEMGNLKDLLGEYSNPVTWGDVFYLLLNDSLVVTQDALRAYFSNK